MAVSNIYKPTGAEKKTVIGTEYLSEKVSHKEYNGKTVIKLYNTNSGSKLTALQHSLDLLHQFESKHGSLSSQGNTRKRLTNRHGDHVKLLVNKFH